MVFTPDGTLAFLTSIRPCPGSILSYTRSADGTLTLASTYPLPRTRCAYGLVVSPDGRYLAEWDNGSGIVQIFNIATGGTLSPAMSLLTVTLDAQGDPDSVSDAVWDASGSYLLLATNYAHIAGYTGGMAVLSFSGSSLAETVYPSGFPLSVIARTGSWVYAHEVCRGNLCPTVDGFDFQNGQLTTLPGSPWTERLVRATFL